MLIGHHPKCANYEHGQYMTLQFKCAKTDTHTVHYLKLAGLFISKLWDEGEKIEKYKLFVNNKQM